MSSIISKGIDVSKHQGTIDWSKVKGNVDFAIIRAGYGKLISQKDALKNNHKRIYLVPL